MVSAIRCGQMPFDPVHVLQEDPVAERSGAALYPFAA